MAEIIKAQYYPEVREGGEVVKPYPKKVHFETSSDVTLYNNSTSGLTAQTAQAAIDELAVKAVSNKQQINEIDEAITELNEEIENLGSDKVDQADIVDNLTEGGTDKVLSAEQGKTLKAQVDAKVATASIVNNLTTGGVDKALSAEQGKTLKGLVDANTQSISQLDGEHKLKVASIERELNACKSVLSSVNVNNEPTQTAEGYGMVSLPKNAANGTMGVKVEGLTATNLVNNGDFSDGTTGWTKQGVTATALDNEATVSVIANYGRLFNRFTPVANNVYYICCDLKATSPDAGLFLRSRAGYNEISISHSGSGVYEKLSAVGAIGSITDATGGVSAGGRTAEFRGDLYVKNAFCANLTAMFGDGNEPTKEQCDAMFANWFDGTKSVATPLRIKSVGKNLFDKANFSYVTGYRDDGGALVASEMTGHTTMKIPALASRQYTISGDEFIASAGYHRFYRAYYYDSLKNWISRSAVFSGSHLTAFTFVTPSNTAFIDFQMSLIAPPIVLANKQLELGSTATTYEPYKESSLYLPDVDDLRSLPNGVCDEISIPDGLKVQRVQEYTLTADNINTYNNTSYPGFDYVICNNFLPAMADYGVPDNICRKIYTDKTVPRNNEFPDGKWMHWTTSASFCISFPKGTYADGAAAKAALAGTKIWYQLATPIVTPIQPSGSLVSQPSGTVYIEKAIADAGIYNNGITVLNTDKPIATLESVSKIDFATGAETPLGVSAAVITQEGLSFTHPGLTDGDIVFFVYFYDAESTEGETTVTYYDSRYVIKNEDDGKFYQWAIKASGTPPTATIELEEV